MNRRELKSDVLRLAFLMGLCAAIGVYVILAIAVISKDGVFYIEQARLIAQDPTGVCRRYPPGFPFLLWAGHAVAGLFAEGDSPSLWAHSAQAVTLLCRMLALVPLYLLGKRLVGAVDSFWAVFVLVILPYPAFYGSDVLREWPYVLFLSTGLLLLHWGLSTRRAWVLALVGLDAGIGYLIRPECAQLVVYVVFGLLLMRKSSDAVRDARSPMPVGVGLLTLAGFIVPIAPYLQASGGVMPQQLRPSTVNMPPVISAVGPETADDAALEFEVRAGELLELPIQTSDPDGDPLVFSLAGVPIGSRPVYTFRLSATGSQFLTVLVREKDLLTAASPKTWNFEGIDWYAYDRPDIRSGLRPVYRFWSPVRQQHFFTMSQSEKDALIAESATSSSWIFEGAVFYAFDEKDPPADATPVYRFHDEQGGYSWAMKPPDETGVRNEGIAWHAHPAGAPPACAAIENGVFRWRPSPSQEGEHQVSILVTDGKADCCQLAIVRVTGSEPQHEASLVKREASLVGSDPCFVTRDPSHAEHGSRVTDRGDAPHSRLLGAADEVVDGLTSDFMFIPVLPWILGMFYLLRRREAWLERALILAVLTVNVGLMLGRHLWIAPGSGRRYCLPLIAVTIFYIPAGLDVMTLVLNRLYTFRGRLAAFGAKGRAPWFYLLMLGGIVLGAPKLISTPLRAEKSGYRVAGEWLRHNTPAEAVVAEPDGRISFYAQRAAIGYVQYPNWRRADFVVEITDSNSMQTPQGWTQVYLGPVDRRTNKTLIVYARARADR